VQTALIVIDVQESFRHRPYFSDTNIAQYLMHQNALIEGCKRHSIPIVRVFHVEGDKVVGNAFAMESGHVRPLQGLADFDAALTVHKQRHSALVGTGLDVWLTQQGIQKLMISGIRTEQCCETTTRHASDLGWQVDYVTDATLTFDMQNADSSMLSTADIKTRTATVLQGRFARVCTVQEALESSRP
jgi:nicotinamidase-related amidase